jgi:hypothetical protein
MAANNNARGGGGGGNGQMNEHVEFTVKVRRKTRDEQESGQRGPCYGTARGCVGFCTSFFGIGIGI